MLTCSMQALLQSKGMPRSGRKQHHLTLALQNTLKSENEIRERMVRNCNTSPQSQYAPNET